jgi:ATP-dependent DNA ligase
MRLPLAPPVAPQLARSATSLPSGPGWAYEPKWDGFRAVVFVEGEERMLQSRGLRPLDRYFPQLRFPAGRYVMDGEIVVKGPDGRPDFGLLQNRIHPAESRVRLLAAETPAEFVAFDLLARGDETLLDRPFEERRAALQELLAGGGAPVDLTPSVASASEAEVWLREAEGVVAKALDAPYRPGERHGMVKVKRVRTIDCVVVGWRPGKAEGTVGSLILGLYEPSGELRVVGHSAGFTGRQKRDLVGRLEPYATGRRGSGDPSRWTAGRELEWVELRPELVVEVSFDHVSNGRIRHGARVLRFRDDKPPRACGVEQLAA